MPSERLTYRLGYEADLDRRRFLSSRNLKSDIALSCQHEIASCLAPDISDADRIGNDDVLLLGRIDWYNANFYDSAVLVRSEKFASPWAERRTIPAEIA